MTTELQAAAAEIEQNTRAEPPAPSSDTERLIRNLKNCAYAHGQTDSIDYASDKKYRMAQEKSEEAAETLRAHIAALEAKVKHLSDERQKLDKRIHNQRMALRENWTITEQRLNWLGKKQIHGRLVSTDVLRSWSKSAKRCLDLEADNRRLREALCDAVATLRYIGKHYCVYKELAEDTFNEWDTIAQTDGKAGE